MRQVSAMCFCCCGLQSWPEERLGRVAAAEGDRVWNQGDGKKHFIQDMFLQLTLEILKRHLQMMMVIQNENHVWALHLYLFT